MNQHTLGRIPSPNQLLMVGFFWGAASLVYQIYGIRILFFYYTESIASVSIGVAVFILGITLGSSLVSWHGFRRVVQRRLLIVLPILSATYAYFFLTDYTVLAEIGKQWGIQSIFLPVALLLIPGVLHGSAFPLLLDYYTDSTKGPSRPTAKFYAVDTLGAVLGSLLCGVVFIPDFGITSAVLFAIMMNILAAALMASWRWLPVFLLGFLLVTADFIAATAIILSPNAKPENKYFGHILFEKHSDFGTVRVSYGKDPDGKRMSIDMRPLCFTGYQTTYHNFAYDIAQKLPPHSHIAVIGLGCGTLLGELVQLRPDVMVDLYEINPVVIEAARKTLAQENKKVLEMPNVRIHVADGKRFLQSRPDALLDGLIIDIEEPSIIYSSPLYTTDYMLRAAKLLKPEGVYAIWAVHFNPDFTTILTNTVRASFSYSEPAYYKPFAAFFAANTIRQKSWHNGMATAFPDHAFNLSEKRVNSLEHNYLADTLKKSDRMRFYSRDALPRDVIREETP